MFSEKALLDTKVDVAKMGTMYTTSHVWDSYRKKQPYLPEPWVYATVAALVGFVLHGLVVSQYVNISTGNPGVDAGIRDVVKVGTALMTQQAILSAMKGKVEFPDAWVTSTAVALAGFFAFNAVVVQHLPQIEGKQAVVTDMAKATFTSAVSHYFAGGQFNEEFFMSTAGVVAGFAAYHEIVAPRLFA